jgi:hypothetical protein
MARTPFGQMLSVGAQLFAAKNTLDFSFFNTSLD